MRSFVLTSAILLATTSPLAVAAKPGTAQPDGSRFVAGDLHAAASDAREPMTWQDAAAHCEALQAHGNEDWRLPDARELALLHRHRAAIGGFPKTPDEELDAGNALGYMTAQQNQAHGRLAYWSSAREGSQAQGLDFTTGTPFELAIEDTPLISSRAVRCVRTAK